MRLKPTIPLLALLLSGCAPIIGTSALPVEVLVVLDRIEHQLRIIPLDSTHIVHTVDLGPVEPSTLAASGTTAVVGLGPAAGVLVVDLAAGRVTYTVPVGLKNPVAAVAMGDNGVAYAASPPTDVVTRINLFTGQTGYDSFPGGPQGFGLARGRLFVVEGNRGSCYPDLEACPEGPSWLRLFGSTRDSVGLSGPGNASVTAVSGDGSLYVLSSGSGGNVEGRLSQVDPVGLAEIAAFGGFGPFPRFLVSDGADRLFVGSTAGGLMVFNTRTRLVERGFGAGIPLHNPQSFATDAVGRVYVVEGGSCSTGGATGVVRIFGTDLVERTGVTLGVCPIAATVTEIPASQFSYGGG
jgi:hypothetical protein